MKKKKMEMEMEMKFGSEKDESRSEGEEGKLRDYASEVSLELEIAKLGENELLPSCLVGDGT